MFCSIDAISIQGGRMGMGNQKSSQEKSVDYGAEYKTSRVIKVIKKDGSLEEFNVQKVVEAVGKSAYRALTKFSEEEKRQICQFVIAKVEELDQDEIPIPIMHNIVLSAAHRRTAKAPSPRGRCR